MAAAEARPFPWSADYKNGKWISNTKHGRKTYARGNRGEYEGMSAAYPTRKVRSTLTGDVYLLPERDYKELIETFRAEATDISNEYADHGNKRLANVQTPADYIDYAFHTPKQKESLDVAECQEGHIKKLTYNAKHKLLMVEFSNNGSICVFFNLPAELAARLMYLARNNVPALHPSTKGDRHEVGVQFWNLVRVRGTQHDTRYPFTYTENNNPGTHSGTNTVASGKFVYGDPGDRTSLAIKQSNGVDAYLDKKENMIFSKAPAPDYERLADYFDNNGGKFYKGRGYNSVLVGKSAPQMQSLREAYDKYMALNGEDNWTEDSAKEIRDLLYAAGIQI